MRLFNKKLYWVNLMNNKIDASVHTRSSCWAGIRRRTDGHLRFAFFSSFQKGTGHSSQWARGHRIQLVPPRSSCSDHQWLKSHDMTLAWENTLDQCQKLEWGWQEGNPKNWEKMLKGHDAALGLEGPWWPQTKHNGEKTKDATEGRRERRTH